MRALWIATALGTVFLWGCGSQPGSEPTGTPSAKAPPAATKAFEWTVMDDSGKTSTAPGSLDDLGVKVYPGATLQPEPAKPMRMDSADHATYTVGFLTPDSPEKIMDFYKSEAKSGASSKIGETLTFIGESKQGDNLDVIAVTDKDSSQTVITLTVKKAKKS